MKLILTIVMMFLSVCSYSDDRTFYTLNTVNGLSDNRVWQLMQLADGRMVVSNGTAIDIYDGSQFTSISKNQGKSFPLPSYHGANHLYYDMDARLWVKDYQSVKCFDLRKLQALDSLPLPEGMAASEALDLFFDTQHQMWLVTAEGLRQSATGTLFPIASYGNLQDLDVLDDRLYLFFASGQVVCYSLSTQSLLYVSEAFSEEEKNLYGGTSLVQRGPFGCFYQLRTGTGGAVFLRFDPTTHDFTRLMTQDYALHTLTITRNDMAYITCPGGYWTMNLSTGESDFQTSLRLPDGTDLGTGINTVCLDREGGIWLGTYDKGVLYSSPYSGLFDSEPVELSLTPILTNVYLHGENVRIGADYDGRVILPESPPYLKYFELSHHQNAVAFRFSTMNYVRPRSTCYRYRFSGDDNQWHTVSADSSGNMVDDKGMLYISFVGLSPGVYTLEVMASTNPDNWTGDMRSVEIEIHAPWWRTWWAYVMYVLVLSLLILTGVMLYMRQMRGKLRQKHKEEMLLLRIQNLVEKVNQYESAYQVVLQPEDESEEKTEQDKTNQMTAAEMEFLNKATSLVEKNISNSSYTVELLSRDLAMERTGLYRKLSALLDKSPTAFIRNIRLHRAAEMLLKGDKSVLEISEITGFCSSSYFSKCFQQEFGCKPSEYAGKVVRG